MGRSKFLLYKNGSVLLEQYDVLVMEPIAEDLTVVIGEGIIHLGGTIARLRTFVVKAVANFEIREIQLHLGSEDS